MYQHIIRSIKQPLIGALLLMGMLSQVAAQCNPDIPLTRPNHRYEAVPGTNGEEVLDKSTGLIWQRCPMGMNWDGKACAGKPNVYTWLGALQVARSAKFNINTPYFGTFRFGLPNFQFTENNVSRIGNNYCHKVKYINFG